MMKEKILAALSVAVLSLSLAACGGPSGEKKPAASGGKYPAQNISGVVQWGAGGGTDSLMRPLASLAEKKLGKSIVIQNMTGATGSIATQFVQDAKKDGYTLLMGAENPALYQALNISKLTYSDFDCVYLIGDETVGIIVGKNSKYKSFKEIVDAAKAAPETIKLSTTGKGGLPWEVGAFIKDVTGATFKQIPYDSDASARTAVISGECDFTVCKVQSGVEDYKAGQINFLNLLALKPVPGMEKVPLITADYPGFKKYLPWGPFYGVFVKKGTDPAIQKTLSDAFVTAGKDESYQKVMKNFNINFKGVAGKEAQDYITAWQKNTVTALKSSGAIK